MVKLYKSFKSERIIIGSIEEGTLKGIEVVGRRGTSPSLEYKESWLIENFFEIIDSSIKIEFNNRNDINKHEKSVTTTNYENLKRLIFFNDGEGRSYYLNCDNNTLNHCDYNAFAEYHKIYKTDDDRVILTHSL